MPSLTKARDVAAWSSKTPAKVVLESLPPAVRTRVPLAVLVIKPVLAPAIEPTVSE